MASLTSEAKVWLGVVSGTVGALGAVAEMAEVEVVAIVVVLFVDGRERPRNTRLGEVLGGGLEGVAPVAPDEPVVEEVVNGHHPAPSVHHARVARATT